MEPTFDNTNNDPINPSPESNSFLQNNRRANRPHSAAFLGPFLTRENVNMGNFPGRPIRDQCGKRDTTMGDGRRRAGSNNAAIEGERAAGV